MLSRLVLFGIGNPGPRYRSTRHNLGIAALERLAAAHEAHMHTGARTYDRAEAAIGVCRVTFLRPRTYVNLSGRVIREFAGGGEIVPAELLVLVDDLALPFGQLRLRRRGSDGGHNGLRSITEALDTKDFPRLRLGAGPVPDGVDAADFVVEPLGTAECRLADALVERAAACVEALIEHGFDRTMSLFNADDAPSESD